MSKSLVLGMLLVLCTLGMACSSEERSQRNREDRPAPEQHDTGVRPRKTGAQQEAIGLGEVAEVGSLRVRAFDFRSEDTVYYMAGPGEPAASQDSLSGEYVTIDYVAENASGSP